MSDPLRSIGVSPPSVEGMTHAFPADVEPQGPSFGDVFKKVVGDTGQMQTDAQDLIGAFLRGEPVELHQVMAASEEASISLQLLVELRNKMTDAYRTIMNLS